MIAFIVDVVRGTREVDGVVLGREPARRGPPAGRREGARPPREPSERQRVRTSSTWRPTSCRHRLIVSGVQAEKVVSDSVEAALELKRVDD